ncbi:MAG: hypothetical protein ACHQUC_07675 [Chlamydiales bacterium]
MRSLTIGLSALILGFTITHHFESERYRNLDIDLFLSSYMMNTLRVEWDDYYIKQYEKKHSFSLPEDYDFGSHWLLLTEPLRRQIDEHFKASMRVPKTYDPGHLQPFEGGKL